ncbi:MAG: NADH-quinone oxidoreductase subunit NuoK [Deltaproteobacteria bacterium]|nr:NADH-quinone oxidoreductase subunit NuoK [Deltaproteobacteria bacterium]
MTITLQHYLFLSLVMFTIGMVGVVVRRNALIIFMSIELMLNAVNIAFLAFSRWSGLMEGQVAVFFVLAVAAAEAGVGLGIIVALYRNKPTVYVDDLRLLRG